MTRDDIIRMAREAGINVEQGFLLRFAGVEDDLERFAELVAAHERERIIAANAPEIEKVNEYIKGLEDSIATVIRARGEK
jgi:5,10-methylenetetrahydrofolate reductase